MRRSICKILILACMVLSGNAMAQRVLVNETVDTSGVISKYGKNRLFYTHPLVKIGLFSPITEDGLYLSPMCTSLSYEMRMKLKICKWNAAIFDFGYRCDRFVIKEDTAQVIPFLGLDHKRERMSIHNFTFALCDRINFGRRGNILGIYLDYGAYGDLVMRSSHLSVNEYYDSNSISAHHVIEKVRSTKLAYINTFNYGLTARLGWEWGSFYGMYRMTDLIVDPSPQTSWPDMPKLMFGVEMYFVD